MARRSRSGERPEHEVALNRSVADPVPPLPPGVRKVAWALVGVLAVAALWFSPLSPVALERGDVLVGSGEARAAVRHYERVGRWHPLASVRVAADLRAATIAAIDLHDARTAREHLRRVAGAVGVDPVVKAAALEQLGQLAWNRLDDPGEAADALQLAHDLAPVGPDADRRLVLAARARTESGDVKAALKAWDRVARQSPSQRALARVSAASLLLGQGDPGSALSSFEEAVAIATDPDVAQIARLGAATCKERLGDEEGALDDLAAADLPGQVGVERQRRLENRVP
jgi:tetratricopeptide (TPR) repeat protein